MTIYRPFLRIAAISGLFAASILCGTAVWATGNVLLPSDNGSSGSPSNLGLTPLSPDNTPAATSSENLVSPPAPLPYSAPSIPPAKTGSYAPLIGGSPAITNITPAFVAPHTPLQVIQQNVPSLDQSIAASLNNITDPKTRQDVAQALQQSMPPHVMHVSMADKYVWGPADVGSVGVQIGLTADQISSHCQMGARGTMTTDKGVYSFDTGSVGADDMHYDGTPSAVLVLLQAMCDTAPKSGAVIQNGDKYQYLVRPLNCPPPPANTSRLTIQYAGNGSGQCQFQ